MAKAALVAVLGMLLALALLPALVVAALVGPPAGAPARPGSTGAGTAGAGTTGQGTAGDIPPPALAAYVAGAARCPGLDWAVLAGIGEVESDHGRSHAPGVQSGANAAGAEGPMQFEPATFGEYAVAVDGHQPSPYDIGDAVAAAARLLCANGAATPGGLPPALWAYNHSWGYVDQVLAWAARYAGSTD